MQSVKFYIEYPRNFGKLYGLNELYKGVHWSKRKAAADFWRDLVYIALRKNNVKKRMFERPVEITFWWDDRLDLSNEAYAAKLIEDALKGYLITDDSKKFVQGIHHLTHDKRCIGVEVREKCEKEDKRTPDFHDGGRRGKSKKRSDNRDA